MHQIIGKHGLSLQQRLDRSRQYLKNVKQKKLGYKNMNVILRKKNGEQKKKKVEQIDTSTLVKSAMTKQNELLLPADLYQFIVPRKEFLRKVELAEEVDANPEWAKFFRDNPDFLELIGRTPSVESTILSNPKMKALLDKYPDYLEMILNNADMTSQQFQDFLADNQDFRDFLSSESELQAMLVERAKMNDKNKVGDNLDEIEMGPLYEMKYVKAKKEGLIITMHYPQDILDRMTLQFSSSTRGVVDIFAYDKKRKKAIDNFTISKEQLVDELGAENFYIEIGKAKFDVEKLITLIDIVLRW
eukprot:c10704_g1_i3.p1 GENE.c10704_g1_i3~~c10704_g1_i3.p1  ORF type:complete len:302 (-),score=84.56 c10704_g1_i3:81-986(-)